MPVRRAIAKLNEYSAPLIEALTREAQEHIEEFSQQVRPVTAGFMARAAPGLQTGRYRGVAAVMCCVAQLDAGKRS